MKRKSKVQPETWTNEDDSLYSRLYKLLSECDDPALYFDEQCELVSLVDKAKRLGVDTDPLPF